MAYVTSAEQEFDAKFFSGLARGALYQRFSGFQVPPGKVPFTRPVYRSGALSQKDEIANSKIDHDSDH
nr:hypothetical protein [Rhodococcus erythropolis]